MNQYEEIEKIGNEAVRRLRKNKLEHGLPFMINANDLPDYQCYLEYPDRSIALVSISKAARDFTIIRYLSKSEANKLRSKYNLSI